MLLAVNTASYVLSIKLVLMRSLIIEDDDAIAKIFGILIQPYFGEIDYAENGQDGLELYRRSLYRSPDSLEIYPYNVIFVDIMMPKIGGLEVLRIIREEEAVRNHSKTCIIMITALDDPDTKNIAYGLGCDDYLGKAINRSIIKQSLTRLGYF